MTGDSIPLLSSVEDAFRTGVGLLVASLSIIVNMITIFKTPLTVRTVHIRSILK